MALIHADAKAACCGKTSRMYADIYLHVNEFRVVINICDAYSNSCSKCTEAIHSPTERNAYPAEFMLQSLTEQNEASHSHDPSWINTPQAALRLIFATMSADVPIAEEIIKPEKY
jgi:hypothetical protein